MCNDQGKFNSLETPHCIPLFPIRSILLYRLNTEYLDLPSNLPDFLGVQQPVNPVRFFLMKDACVGQV